MIKVILKDKINKQREEKVIFETFSPVKAVIFLKAIKNSLIWNQWEIKTRME